MATTSERLKELMEIHGLTQTELCSRTGIGKSIMSRWVNGQRMPKQDGLTRIADAFNVSEVWLMGKDVPMKRIAADQTTTDNEMQELIEIYKTIDADRESFLKYLMLAKKLDELPEDKRSVVVNMINLLNNESEE